MIVHMAGRAIAQAFSCQLPTAAAQVRSQLKSCGIDTGAGFLRVLRFPLPSLIPPNASYSSIIRGRYNTPISGLRTKWTQSQPGPRS
jgi:hypothetical protein